MTSLYYIGRINEFFEKLWTRLIQCSEKALQNIFQSKVNVGFKNIKEKSNDHSQNKKEEAKDK